MIRMSRLARLTALAVALTALAALVLHVQVGLMRHPQRPLSVELWRVGRYFTILTVAMVALFFGRAALSGRVAAAWAAGVMLWTAIVATVYHTLLARELSGLRLLADHMLHSIVPALVVGWWLAFAPKAGLRPAHALWWLVWPALYAAYALIRGEIDNRHPYFFIDPPLIGWPRVLLWLGLLGAVFWLAGRALVWLAARRTDRPPGAPLTGG